MALTLKVVTLNCWGLPFPVVCKHRQERISAIGDFLRDENFDIVILEEIWVKADFHLLRDKLEKKMPFSHYFYSGTIGSGMCVFSKHFIAETSYHRFQLNGHAHKILHGDWFGGKGVGLCKIQIQGLNISLYCSHFHAEYNFEQDEYESHRLTQAFELAQFIRMTCLDCDVVILAGDLNTTCNNLGYKIITQHAELKDTWLEKENIPDEHGGTCDVPGNTYTTADKQARCPQGERIDYIMYRERNNSHVKVTECLTGIGKIPHLSTSYSDHEAVIATLSIYQTAGCHDTVSRPELCRDVKECLQESLLVLDKGVAQCLSEEKFFQVVVFLLSIILYALNSYVDLSAYPSGLLLAFSLAATKLFLAIALGFSVWTALIVKRGEFHGLIACKEDIMKLLGIQV